MKINLTWKNGKQESFDDIYSVKWGKGKLTIDFWKSGQIVIKTSELYAWVIS